MIAKDYQNFVHEKLQNIYGELAIKEWSIKKDSGDRLPKDMYCPRIDIAVGPYNIDGQVSENNRRINLMIDEQKSFLRKLVNKSETDVGDIDDFLQFKNKNPRCFLGIEIEASGGRKHMLGDIANASIISAIGIVIPLNDRLKGFKGIKKYIEFATRVGKMNSSFNNVLIITEENFTQILSEIGVAS